MKTPGQTVGPKDERTEGQRERRRDGQTLFHRVLPATTGDPITIYRAFHERSNESDSFLKHLKS